MNNNIKKIIDNSKYSYEYDGFPVRTKSLVDKHSLVLFGLKSQGVIGFIDRCIEDGAGWKQIANAIGWIGTTAFESYYNQKYKELFEINNIRMIDPNDDLTEGFLLFKDKKLNIVKKSVFRKDASIFESHKFRNIQFLNRDKEISKDNTSLDCDFYMKEDNPFSNMCFHTTMKKNNHTKTITSNFDNFPILINEILNYQDNGYYRATDIYFDFLETDNDIKASVGKSNLTKYYSIGLK